MPPPPPPIFKLGEGGGKIYQSLEVKKCRTVSIWDLGTTFRESSTWIYLAVTIIFIGVV